VTVSPEDRIVFLAAGQANFALSATISSPEAEFIGFEWMVDGVTVSPDTSGYIVTSQAGITPSDRIISLTIMTFNPMIHTGNYQLLTTGTTGTAVSANWLLKESSKNIYVPKAFKVCTCNNVQVDLILYIELLWYTERLLTCSGLAIGFGSCIKCSIVQTDSPTTLLMSGLDGLPFNACQILTRYECG